MFFFINKLFDFVPIFPLDNPNIVSTILGSMEKKENKKKKFTNLIKSASEAFYHSKTDERDMNGETFRKYKFRLSISSPKEETYSPDEIIIKNPNVTPTKQDTQEAQKKIRALKILQKMTEEATDEVKFNFFF
jgi:hypothetical protein